MKDRIATVTKNCSPATEWRSSHVLCFEPLQFSALKKNYHSTDAQIKNEAAVKRRRVKLETGEDPGEYKTE